MEEENIKLINQEEKTYFKKRKYLEVVFQIPIDDLKQIILMKDEAIEFFYGNKKIQI